LTHVSLEQRIRAALADTSEAPPRPLSPIELPLKLEKLLTPKILASLRPASVLVPLVRRERELHVLFTRRSEEMRAHKGQISFPGGRREPSDPTAAAAAMREAHEEVGIPPTGVEVIGYLDDYPTVTGYLVTPVVGVIESVQQLKPCAREVAEIFEVPLPFVLEQAHFERRIFTRDGINVPFFELNYGRHRIWGATAGMLWNLAGKLTDVR
jgi:8-oxo-dGTP pyrophosphatase MutT (NUDIX family)